MLTVNFQSNWLYNREQVFEFLYEVNPVAAEKTDDLIEAKVEQLLQYPLLGVQRAGMHGRLLSILQISMIVLYWGEGTSIRVLRVLHQKQKFPAGGFTKNIGCQ